ncbi:MAG: hypothetical protein OXN95_05185 [bacterium]|nr:hypothetical protein [bacterium]
MTAADAYALAYETGLRTLDEQASALREIRDRAGRLLTTATLTGGFVAGLILTADPKPGTDPINTSWWALAIAGFAAVILSTMYVWRPVKIQVTQNSATIVSSFIEGSAQMTLPQVHRELALWFGDHSYWNRRPLERAQNAFRASQLALLIEMTGLILTIGDAINV